MSSGLKYASLREQVYKYLRQQMNRGDLLPGSSINIGEIARQLGISKTPLRDALIHLELEGFVTILPRRGVCVNRLSFQDIKNAYDSVGLIESFIVTECIDRIGQLQVKKLEELNKKMISNIEKNDFSKLFQTNLRFHDVYLDISENEPLKKFIRPIKHRLYDFPRQNYIKEWELRNCEEHSEFIEHLRKGDAVAAAKVLKDIHWSFDYQKDFIHKLYQDLDDPGQI
ncbi:GntR family transcriptional regulator [Desulfomarina profundi]|uniref:GntR family transcriptional regulator n=1 Tax=Desulfomarina profundi TaxID=2772557 RepID=A0A8D5FIS9_9BACT|nr:GntR family transcriptional regulator [Desulfomarina profundi]BCL62143.1 GntR family transcriptional regulator [Desulfomarina profundi]